DIVGDFDFDGGREARAILVATVADRLDSESAQLGFQRIGALLLEHIDHLLEQVGQYVVHHRCGHGVSKGNGFGTRIPSENGEAQITVSMIGARYSRSVAPYLP